MSDDGTIVALNNNDGSKVYRYSNNTWTQLGQDISDYSLNSISLSGDGTTVATGRVTAGTEFQGEVRVYKYTNNTWTELGNRIRGEAWTDESGYSVSLSRDGTRVAIGAPRAGGPYINDGNEENAGHVRVYDWDGYNWKKIGQDIDGEAAGDWSGYSVSLSGDGNRLIMGSPHSPSDYGRVYHYDNNTWSLDYVVSGPGHGAIGWSVSMSRDGTCLLYTSPSPRDVEESRMPSSA